MGNTNPILNSLIVESNKTRTENGALSNKSTLNDLLDFFASGGSTRERSEDYIIHLFQNAFAQDKLSALKLLFYFRDCREGQGERRLFRTIIKWLANHYSEYLIKNMKLIPYYGRWDDLFSLFGTKCESKMLDYIVDQLLDDLSSYKECKNISLLAKWIPSINTSNKTMVYYANKLVKRLNITKKEYRKFLSKLRNYANVVEKQMCANEWNLIEYPKIPSIAALRYRQAFLKHDNTRYSQYIRDVSTGKSKVNAKTLYPYDIVRTILFNKREDFNEDDILALDNQWKSLPNYYPDDSDQNMIVVCDVSGSMYSGIPNISVSVALSIYCAEKIKGPFKDYFITFSEKPVLERIKGNNIYEKTTNIFNSQPGYNTNLIAVFRTLLNKMKLIEQEKGIKLTEKDIPSHIMIISDMQFDCNDYKNQYDNLDDFMDHISDENTTYQDIKQMYEEHGFKLPKIIWWNVGGRSSAYPITKTDSGNIIVSGCSPTILTSLFDENKDFSPESYMFDVINRKRYDLVKI